MFFFFIEYNDLSITWLSKYIPAISQNRPNIIIEMLISIQVS